MTQTYPIVLRAPDGSTLRLERFPVVMGRATPGAPAQPDCDVAPFDREGRVSRQHAVIDWREGRLYVTDLGSTNGTRLNNAPLQPHQPVEIGPSGVVTLGELPIVVEVEGATARPPTAATPPAAGAPSPPTPGMPPPPAAPPPGAPPAAMPPEMQPEAGEPPGPPGPPPPAMMGPPSVPPPPSATQPPAPTAAGTPGDLGAPPPPPVEPPPPAAEAAALTPEAETAEAQAAKPPGAISEREPATEPGGEAAAGPATVGEAPSEVETEAETGEAGAPAESGALAAAEAGARREAEPGAEAEAQPEAGAEAEPSAPAAEEAAEGAVAREPEAADVHEAEAVGADEGPEAPPVGAAMAGAALAEETPTATAPGAPATEEPPGAPPTIGPAPPATEFPAVAAAVAGTAAAAGAGGHPSAPGPPPGDRVGTLLYALGDPNALEVQVEVGRVPLVRTDHGWSPIGDGPLTTAEWARFWGAFCERTGTDPASSGYVARLLDNAVTAEAVLPPVSTGPSFTARRLPPRRRLDELVGAQTASGVRSALASQRGVIVLGDPRQAVTSVLEAVVDVIPPGGRVALVELRPQIRHSAASVLRLRSQQGQGTAAVDLAMTTSPDWLVIDEALPEAAGTAAWRHGAGGPVPILAGRAPNPFAWRDRAMATINALAANPGAGGPVWAASYAMFLTVTPTQDGGFGVNVGQ